MVKINEEWLMKVNGASAAVASFGLLSQPKFVNDKFVSGTVPTPMMRHGGVMAASIAALNTTGAKADYVTRKQMLKVNGAAWLACTALTLYNVNKGGQKREASIGLATATGVLGTVNLVAGFRQPLKNLL